MADSVDRVFSHALNTVNKIRTGSEKPPTAVRLKLYGLYKQAMEGDVEGIMDRPQGNSEEASRTREKWDSWKAQSGCSRTEAKRRYITTLITAMHRYASPSADVRELVAELEFVWDQVKSNIPSSDESSSSPFRNYINASHNPNAPPPTNPTRGPLRILSPPLQAGGSNRDGPEEDDDDDDEEFVDAPDSQYEPRPAMPSRRPPAGPSTTADRKWRASVEKALVRLTAEVAALREQLEARRLFRQSRRGGLLAWIGWLLKTVIGAAVADLVVLFAVLGWLRWRGRRKWEALIWLYIREAAKRLGRVRLPGMPKKAD